MKTKTLKLTLTSSILLFFFSCLTINIYFPEAAVRKTADEIVEEIRKSDEEEKEIKKSVPEEKQGNSFSFIPLAYAQEEVATVSSPKIRALKQSLRERFPKLRPFFDKGNIGEANNGFVRVRNESGLSLKEKAQLRKLEKDENSDRRNLYAEVAKAMDIDSSQIDRIQKIFAGRWIKSSRPGWWIQEENGQWVKKQ